MTWAAVAALAALAAGCSDDAAEVAPRVVDRPNVVLIVVDTLRADHVSAYGSGARTPNIDALARSGVRFDRAYAHASMTGPSHASMFTGLLPRDHGVHKNAQVLEDRFDTLAEILAPTRETAAFLSLGALRDEFNFDQGFALFWDDFDLGWWRNAGAVNERVLPWLAEHADEPFFMWVHYSDPHEPYWPPIGRIPFAKATFDGRTLAVFPADGNAIDLRLRLPPGEHTIGFEKVAQTGQAIQFNHVRVDGAGKRIDGNHLPTIGRDMTGEGVRVRVAREGAVRVQFRPHVLPQGDEEKREGYRREAEYVDRKVGELLDALERHGLRDETIVVLTSDHGEELGEYSKFFGHVHNLYEVLIRVPLIISFPGVLPDERVVSERVQHVDLLPTLLALLGMDPPPAIRGQSLLPLTGIAADRPVVAATHHQQKKAVLFDRYKYVRSEQTGAEELYDLLMDPAEKRNIAAGRADITERARAILAQVLSSVPREAATPRDAELSPEEVEALRALGYTD